MPPGAPAWKGSIRHALTTFGWFDGTALRFTKLSAPAPIPAGPAPPPLPAFSCCENNIATGPGNPTVKSATFTDAEWQPATKPPTFSRQVRIVITVPINLDCREGEAGQQCVGRFEVAPSQRPQQGPAGARVGPVLEEVRVTAVFSKPCGSGHVMGTVDVEWRGVYPANTAVTGNLQIGLSAPAAKGGLNQNLDVPEYQHARAREGGERRSHNPVSARAGVRGGIGSAPAIHARPREKLAALCLPTRSRMRLGCARRGSG
jgi:hypothetical protein